MSNAVITYIDDNIDNFDTPWIPFTPERRKPFVIKAGGEYLLFAYKARAVGHVRRTVNGVSEDVPYAENVITLSRGFTSDVFGEECVCFPRYAYQSLDSVIEGALSFENHSLVMLPDGTWRMYFNVLFDDGEESRHEIWKADTGDFDEWRGFCRVGVTLNGSDQVNVRDPFVMACGGDSSSSSSSGGGRAFIMYASVRMPGREFSTIEEYSSADGVSFEWTRSLYMAIDGLYDCRSPYVFVADGVHRKILYTVLSSSDANGIRSSSIVSLEWDGGDWSTQVHGETGRLIVEKGEGEGAPFAGAFGGRYSNPCLIWDVDHGCPVQRIYYNSFDGPWIWCDGKLVKAGGICDITIHTDYLEKYTWEEESVGDAYSIYHAPMAGDLDSAEWTRLQDEWMGGDGPVEVPDALPAGHFIRYDWQSEHEKCFAVKVATGAIENSVRCMSQGRWIGFDNVDRTEAMLRPEFNYDLDYSLDNYSATAYINEQELGAEMAGWQGGVEGDSDEDNAIRFLVDTKRYPKYVWWSRKGPGIYRYVGWNVMKDYFWNGDA